MRAILGIRILAYNNMPIFEIHVHQTVNLDEVVSKLDHIIKHQHEIMGTIQDLTSKISELETAWTQENQEIVDKLTALQSEVASLKETIANSGTPQQIDEQIARIDALIVDVKDTVTPDETPEP